MSSMLHVATVDRQYGTLLSSAALAANNSPLLRVIPAKPVGARIRGDEYFVPKRSTL